MRRWSQSVRRGKLRCFVHDSRERTRMPAWRATGRNEETDMSLVVVSDYYSAPLNRR